MDLQQQIDNLKEKVDILGHNFEYLELEKAYRKYPNTFTDVNTFESTTNINGNIEAGGNTVTPEQLGNIGNHLEDFNNPHVVTKEQVGLYKVNNTNDLEKPISTATQSALNAINAKLENCWNKDNFRVESGKLTLQVTPSRLGVGSFSGNYTIIGNKCFIDIIMSFNGLGVLGNNDLVEFRFLPVPPKSTAVQRPLGFVQMTSNKVYTCGYVAVRNSGVVTQTLSQGIGKYDSLVDKDIVNKTSVSMQFWYEI